MVRLPVHSALGYGQTCLFISGKMWPFLTGLRTESLFILNSRISKKEKVSNISTYFYALQYIYSIPIESAEDAKSRVVHSLSALFRGWGGCTAHWQFVCFTAMHQLLGPQKIFISLHKYQHVCFNRN